MKRFALAITTFLFLTVSSNTFAQGGAYTYPTVTGPEGQTLRHSDGSQISISELEPGKIKMIYLSNWVEGCY